MIYLNKIHLECFVTIWFHYMMVSYFDSRVDETNFIPFISGKKNILGDIKTNKILEYTKLYVSPGIDLRKYLSFETISELNYETDLDIFFKEPISRRQCC